MSTSHQRFQERARALAKNLKVRSTQKRATAMRDLWDHFPEDADDFMRQCMRNAPDHLRNSFVLGLFGRHVTPERNSRRPLPEEFMRLLRVRLSPEDHRSGEQWLEDCSAVNAALEKLIRQLGSLENRRRHLPQTSRDYRTNDVGIVSKRLRRAAGRYLQVSQQYTISRTLLLEQMLDNIDWVFKPLRLAFPDEQPEWDWLEVRAQQLPRALWVFRDLLAELDSADISVRRHMDKALEDILRVGHRNHSGVEFYLEHFEMGAPLEARQIIAGSLNSSPRSPFDPRQYEWREPCAQLDQDLARFAGALQQLSPLGRSLITVVSLHRVLSSSPQSYGLAPILYNEEAGPLYWTLSCWMDFTGTPEVTPSKWPYPAK
jgi:hypothetical protein